MLDRIPWRSEEVTVVAAPMFHAWGFGQLVISATLTCTVVTRRKFDPEATLEMVRSSGATGLGVVPVMIERIMELPAEVLDRYPLKGQLRFVTASGSRMRSDAVISFMDRFGDTIYNSYNATEAGPDQHRGAGGPAGGARHRGQAGGRHRPADPRRRRPRGAAGRGRPDHRAQRLPVLRLHLGRQQGVPRRLHGLRRRGPGRRGREALRRRPGRRDDRVRRRERVPARGRGDPQRRTPRCARRRSSAWTTRSSGSGWRRTSRSSPAPR